MEVQGYFPILNNAENPPGARSSSQPAAWVPALRGMVDEGPAVASR